MIHISSVLFLLIFITEFLIAPVVHPQETRNELKLLSLTGKGIPAGERSIHSMTTKGGIIYGATSGRRAHIFRFNPATGEFRDIAQINGPVTIHHSLTLDSDESLWLGTTMDRTQLYFESRKKGEGLHLTEVSKMPITPDLHVGNLYRILKPDSEQPVIEEIGMPVPGQAIHSMICDPKRKIIYGFTFPLGRFFIYDITTGKTETIIYGKRLVREYPDSLSVTEDVTEFIPNSEDILEKNIAKALILDREGNLYTSGHKGKLLRLKPGSRTFEEAGSLPCVPGREEWASAEALTWAPDGSLYGATIDGYVFKYNPLSKKLVNLGKPFRSQGISGLVCRSDGTVYGIGGGTLEGLARFFVYDPSEGGFQLATILKEDKNKSSAEWKTTYSPLGIVSFHGVGSMVVDPEDRIIIGETMRKANLLMICPLR
jgi:hypothetical protein